MLGHTLPSMPLANMLGMGAWQRKHNARSPCIMEETGTRTDSEGGTKGAKDTFGKHAVVPL